MKKVLAMSLAIATATPAVMFGAARGSSGNHTMAGCGLGYVLFAHEDNSKIKQILGATTNGTSGNQTFGITSGTSGCTEDGAVKFVKEAEVYAEVNLDSLRREMAAGQGEFVNSFASLLGATDKTRPELVKFVQSEYSALFPKADTPSAELLETLQSKLSQHPELLG